MSSLSEKSGDGSILGRFRNRSSERRTIASCFAHSSHSAMCRCTPTSSIPESVSSMKAECVLWNSRQSMRHGSGVWVPVPVRWVLVPPKLITLLHVGRNNLREGVPCPVQPRFDRAKIAVRDLGNLLVGLALELPEDEDMPMMLGQLCHRFLDYFPQVPLPVHVVRPRGRVLELERPIVILPVFLNRLHQDQRISRAIPELVFRQVRCNRVRPGRELLRPVETMKMPVHANEHFLNQILRFLPITDRPVNEVQQASLVPLHQLRERSFLSPQESGDDS